MELEILRVVRKRNFLLQKYFDVNEEIISNLTESHSFDFESFYISREQILTSIRDCEGEILTLSMSRWEKFKFDPQFKESYIKLTSEKKALVTQIIDQDLLIMSTLGVTGFEKSA